MSGSGSFEDPNLEIRHLPVARTTQLASILDDNDLWKELMSIIPRNNESVDTPCLYSFEDIRLVQSTARNRCCSPTEILLSEWGITNRKRPTLSVLLECLVKAQLFRAADFVANIINVPPPKRPSHGPAARIMTSSVTAECVQPYMFSPIMMNNDGADMNRIPMQLLIKATNNFDQEKLLGVGSFGDVYKASLPSPWGTVAVKRLHEDKIQEWATTNVSSSSSSSWKSSTVGKVDCGHPMKQFINEVNITSKVKHKNLLSMLAYSEDPTSPPCLVYEYMINGSLLDKLIKKTELGWNTRMTIAQGTAEGIHYLHSQETPLIHRDVKSANILLDKDFNPKLGDYGLVRLGSKHNSTINTTKAYGTPLYMSYDALRGFVSVKMDVYSFGVVLLELVMGRPVMEEYEDKDLVTFFDGHSKTERANIWDKRAGWPTELPIELFDLVDSCLITKMGDRPTMTEVVKSLEPIVNKYRFYV